MTLHKDLTGADLHEPKDIDDATDGQVYIADGSGSGAWGDLTIPSGEFLMTFAFYSSSATWSKPSNLIGVQVHLVGGGGGSNGGSGTAGDGGTTSFGGKSAFGGAGATVGSNGNAGTGGTCGLGFAGGKDAFPFGSIGTYGDGGSDAKVGGAGEYTISYIRASDLSATESLVVGAGGTKAPGGLNNGASGAAYLIHYIKAT